MRESFFDTFMVKTTFKGKNLILIIRIDVDRNINSEVYGEGSLSYYNFDEFRDIKKHFSYQITYIFGKLYHRIDLFSKILISLGLMCSNNDFIEISLNFILFIYSFLSFM